MRASSEMAGFLTKFGATIAVMAVGAVLSVDSTIVDIERWPVATTIYWLSLVVICKESHTLIGNTSKRLEVGKGKTFHFECYFIGSSLWQVDRDSNSAVIEGGLLGPVHYGQYSLFLPTVSLLTASPVVQFTFFLKWRLPNPIERLNPLAGYYQFNT